jgi:hypothetical protein
MHGVRLLIVITCGISGALTMASLLFYVPWFRSLMKARDPVEFERTGTWVFPPPSQALNLCLYLLRREYRRCLDPVIRRHGALLRWTYSFPLFLATFTLLLSLGIGPLFDR